MFRTFTSIFLSSLACYFLFLSCLCWAWYQVCASLKKWVRVRSSPLFLFSEEVYEAGIIYSFESFEKISSKASWTWNFLCGNISDYWFHWFNESQFWLVILFKKLIHFHKILETFGIKLLITSFLSFYVSGFSSNVPFLFLTFLIWHGCSHTLPLSCTLPRSVLPKVYKFY